MGHGQPRGDTGSAWSLAERPMMVVELRPVPHTRGSAVPCHTQTTARRTVPLPRFLARELAPWIEGRRHTAATLAIASGADVKVVQLMLGHSTATLTLDLYGHLFPD